VRTRRTGGGINRRKRRNRRNYKGAGLEINKASGGFKSIINTGAVRHLAINEYGRLMLTKAGSAYSYAMTLKKQSHSTELTTVDLSELINESEEFNEWCRCSSQYKIYGIRISIDYARIPEAGDTLARLLMSVRTDKADVQDAKIERNVMNLDMSMTGVKNFNFNLNNRNTYVEHLGWTDTQDLFGAVLQLKIEGQDITMLKDTEPSSVLLGTVKISIMAKCRLRDYIPGNNNKRPVLRRMKLQIYQSPLGLESQHGKINVDVNKLNKDEQSKDIGTNTEDLESDSEYGDEEEQVKAFSSPPDNQ
jgi:hypothetical protein